MAVSIIKAEEPESSKTKASYEQLSKTAKALNANTDKLTKVAKVLEASLKKLNLGVSAWVEIQRTDYESGAYVIYQLGFAKLNDEWGLSIRRFKGNDNYGDDGSDPDVWAFNAASRSVRIRAIEFIPELIDELNALAAKMVAALEKSTNEAEELANAISEIATGAGR